MDGKAFELAEEESITPAAPIAPRRSISRLLKVTNYPPEPNSVFIIQRVNGR
jgi:hypothetical protein